MTALILSYVLGPMENNTYVLADPQSGEAALVDPSYEIEPLLADVKRRGLKINQILLTHAHFDHTAGVSRAAATRVPPIPVSLHPADLDLYRRGGGAMDFDLPFEPAPVPQSELADGQKILVGSVELYVRHTPGHTPGHVVLVCPEAGAVFCGDLIFAGSVGRTDMPGGDTAQLLDSIRRSILSLPPQTRLLSGHGPETTVADESANNPYLR